MIQSSGKPERALLLLTRSERYDLLWLARATIRAEVCGEPRPTLRAPAAALLQPGAAFVSLHVEGRLRGCVGSVVPERAVHEAVARAAHGAAFQDSRFEPVSAEELAAIDIEISRVGPMWLTDPREICPGRHGVCLRLGQHHALFLPQVAVQQRWERQELLIQLCEKAQLPPGAWKHRDAQLLVFEAEVFGEKDA